MTSLLRELADALQVNSEDKARAFCVQVQKIFKSQPPSLEEIIECVKLYPRIRRSPELVARVIGQGSVKLTPSKKNVKKSKNINQKFQKKQFAPKISAGAVTGFIDDIHPSSPAMRHDPRKFTDGFEKCPHGVPKTGICHICRGGTIDY